MSQINPNLFPNYLSASDSIPEKQIDSLSHDKECDGSAAKLEKSKENVEDPYDLDIVVSAKNDGSPQPTELPASKLTCFTCIFTFCGGCSRTC